ncbi:hypothetical protein BKA63DRAFT_240069 [Paraphoma chrysanthemicola]|nr:hypothetical protein BKA63DRAFT_240069 [Paraphoma chrysanthemicola]
MFKDSNALLAHVVFVCILAVLQLAGSTRGRFRGLTCNDVGGAAAAISQPLSNSWCLAEHSQAGPILSATVILASPLFGSQTLWNTDEGHLCRVLQMLILICAIRHVKEPTMPNYAWCPPRTEHEPRRLRALDGLVVI